MSLIDKHKRLEAGIFLKSDAAEACRISPGLLKDWINRQLVPAPTRPYGDRLAYTTEEVETLKLKTKELRKASQATLKPVNHRDAGLINKSELGAACGINAEQVARLVNRGDIPPPDRDWHGKMKYWAKEDLPKLRRAVMSPHEHHPYSVAKPKRDGYVSVQEVRERIGVSFTTIYHHEHRGAIPQPTAQFVECPNRRWYTEAEAQQVIDFFEKPKVPEGYLANGDMAKKLGITTTALRAWLRQRPELPQATHTFHGVAHKRYFSAEEADHVIAARRVSAANAWLSRHPESAETLEKYLKEMPRQEAYRRFFVEIVTAAERF